MEDPIAASADMTEEFGQEWREEGVPIAAFSVHVLFRRRLGRRWGMDEDVHSC